MLHSRSSTEPVKCDMPEAVLSKKYYTLPDLEKDNGVDVYFDKDLDPTDYGILHNHAKMKSSMSAGDFVKHLTKAIQSGAGIRVDRAHREATSVVNGRRLVEEGELAVLGVVEGENVYYRRENNTWVFEKDVDILHASSNKRLTCAALDCVILKDECVTGDNLVESDKQRTIQRMLADKEYVVRTTQDAYGKYIRDRYHSVRSIWLARDATTTESQVSKTVASENLSPYTKLRDKILSIVDIGERSEYVILFRGLCCRSALDNESAHWYYCKDTSEFLLPTFFHDFAVAFSVNHNYTDVVRDVRETRGVLSNEGDKWVDKYSGYVICDVDLVDDRTYPLYGPDIKENAQEIADKPIALRYIENIITSLCSNMGIANDYLEGVSRKALSYLNNHSQLKNPDLYNEIRKKRMLEGSNTPEYEIAYNRTMFQCTLGYLIAYISTREPSYTTLHKFPNCKSQFDGYPVGNDPGVVKFVCCITIGVRTAYPPWNSIAKMNEANLVTMVNDFLRLHVTNTVWAQKLVRNKIRYLAKRTVSLVEVTVILTDSYLMPPKGPLVMSRALVAEVADEFFVTKRVLMKQCDPRVSDSIYAVRSKVIALCMARNAERESIAMNQGLLFSSNKTRLNYYVDKTPSVSTKYLEQIARYKHQLRADWHESSHIQQKFGGKPIQTNFIDEFDVSEMNQYLFFVKKLNFDNNKPIPKSMRAFSEQKPTSAIDYRSPAFVDELKREGYAFDKALFYSAWRLIMIGKTMRPPPSNLAARHLQIREFPTSSVITDDIKTLYSNYANPNAPFNRLQYQQLISHILQETNYAMMAMKLNKSSEFKRVIEFDGAANGTLDGLMRMKNYIRLLTVYPNRVIYRPRVPSSVAHWNLSKKHYSDINEFIARDTMHVDKLRKHENTDNELSAMIVQWRGIASFSRLLESSASDCTIETAMARYLVVCMIRDAFVANETIANAYVQTIIDTDKVISYDYERVMVDIGLIKHNEQMQILARFQTLTDEERIIENALREYKLGQWDVDLKNVIKYNKDIYDADLQNAQRDSNDVIHEYMTDVYDDRDGGVGDEEAYDMRNQDDDDD